MIKKRQKGSETLRNTKMYTDYLDVLNTVAKIVALLPTSVMWALTLTDDLPAVLNIYVANEKERIKARTWLIDAKKAYIESDNYETYHLKNLDVSLIEKDENDLR